MSQKQFHIASLIIIITGIAVFSFYVLSGGLMTTSDSAHYVSASYHLFHNGALLGVGKEAFTAFPPLYPMLLAVAHFFSNPLVAMSMLHILIYTINAILITFFFKHFFGSTYITLGLLVFTLFSSPFMVNHVFIWSEAFFYTLCIPWFFLTLKVSKKQDIAYWAILTVVSLLLTMQRKTGFIFVLASTLFILLSTDHKTWKLYLSTGVYLLVSSSFTFAWRFRAQMLTNEFMYDKHFSWLQTWKAINEEVIELGEWMIPRVFPDGLKWAVVLALIAGMMYVFRKHKLPPEIKLSILLFFAYSGAIISFMTFYKLSQTMDIRVMGSILPFLLLIVGFLVKKISEMGATHRYVIVVCVGGIVLYNIARSYKNLEQWKSVPKKSLTQLLGEH